MINREINSSTGNLNGLRIHTKILVIKDKCEKVLYINKSISKILKEKKTILGHAS